MNPDLRYPYDGYPDQDEVTEDEIDILDDNDAKILLAQALDVSLVSDEVKPYNRAKALKIAEEFVTASREKEGVLHREYLRDNKKWEADRAEMNRTRVSKRTRDLATLTLLVLGISGGVLMAGKLMTSVKNTSQFQKNEK